MIGSEQNRVFLFFCHAFDEPSAQAPPYLPTTKGIFKPKTWNTVPNQSKYANYWNQFVHLKFQILTILFIFTAKNIVKMKKKRKKKINLVRNDKIIDENKNVSISINKNYEEIIQNLLRQ